VRVACDLDLHSMIPLWLTSLLLRARDILCQGSVESILLCSVTVFERLPV
jgi:hypothetical protein